MKTNRGQTLVEFAIAVPLLALLLFGIIQWGYIFAVHMSLRHAANVTARTLTLTGGDASTSNAVATAKIAIAPMLDVSKLSTVIVANATVATADDALRVQLAYNLPLIIQFVVPGATGSNYVVRAQAIYRKGG